MNTIFLDTVGLVALWDQRDQWHTAAKSCFAAQDPNTSRYITTSYVLVECANHAARRVYRPEVVKLREELIAAGDLFDPLLDEIRSAWEDYARGGVGTASLVDHISFAVMRRLGVTKAFTNDKHFTAAGFEILF